ncbi:hypothetical protein TKK_0015765 [Trichogramma kaykai]|uniref:Selenoprotein S n=1 Tax=Trichogramma kaykai TaxID=54128 RepID=A0ABD2W7U9_9HYME
MHGRDSNDGESFEGETMVSYYKLVLLLITNVGWYIVGTTVILIYAWPFLYKQWLGWKKKKDDYEYDAKYHKNVDLNSKLLLAQHTAREKMEQKYLQDREIAIQKEQAKKMKKQQELLKLQSQLLSDNYRLDSNESKDSTGPSKSRLRADYNPLMGSGSSGKYVPPKRSACSKRGCGRQ